MPKRSFAAGAGLCSVAGLLRSRRRDSLAWRCTNPDALIASSLSVVGLQHLLMGGLRKGLTFESVGVHLKKEGHVAYLYGTDASEINEQMGGGYKVFKNLAEAFAAAAKNAHNGEVVMLAPGCASTDQFEDFRHRGAVFTKLAKEWLER